MGRRDKRRRRKKQMEKQSAAATQAKNEVNPSSEEIRKRKEKEAILKEVSLLRLLS